MAMLVSLVLTFGVLIPTVIAGSSLSRESEERLAKLLLSLMWPAGLSGVLLITMFGKFSINPEVLYATAGFLTMTLLCGCVLKLLIYRYGVNSVEIRRQEREDEEKHLRAVRDLVQEISGYAMGLVEIVKVAGNEEMLKRASRPLHALNLLGRFAQQVGRLNLEPLARLINLIERGAAPDHVAVRETIQELEVLVEKLERAEVDESLLRALELSGGIGVAHEGTLEQRIAAAHVTLRQLGREVVEAARAEGADPDHLARITIRLQEIGASAAARARTAHERVTGK